MKTKLLKKIRKNCSWSKEGDDFILKIKNRKDKVIDNNYLICFFRFNNLLWENPWTEEETNKVKFRLLKHSMYKYIDLHIFTGPLSITTRYINKLKSPLKSFNNYGW